MNFIYNNNGALNCSAAHPVPKPGAVMAYRLTIDYRMINSLTLRAAWPMPVLEIVLQYVQGCRYFATFDLFKGFWQFPLHEDSQEYFSFATDSGVFTPTRVMQGSADGVAACQSAMQQVLGDLLYNGCLLWLDDVLIYAKTEAELVSLVAKFLARVAEYGVKLNPAKCDLFLTEVKWCGKLISYDGVRYDPARIEALRSLSYPLD